MSGNTSRNRVVLVTGGASGIGAACVRRFHGEGAHVLLADRDEAGATALAAELGEGRVSTVVYDQEQPDQISDVLGAALDSLERLDVVAACAGYGRYGELLTVPLETWNRHQQINTTGTFLVLRAAANRMIATGSAGSIVLIGSTASTYPTDLFGAYAVAKAGVLMLTRAAASELGSYRIRVNAILPGVVESAMTASILADDAARELLCAETPLGRPGVPNDIAAAVAFLASDAAGYITGTSLLIDGGQTLHGFPRWFSTDHREHGKPRWQPHPRRELHPVATPETDDTRTA